MKSILVVIMAAIVAAVPLSRLKALDRDAWERDRVLLVYSQYGTCTGVKVQAPSGKRYILTAGHCRGLVENGVTSVKTESGEAFTVKEIAEDPNSDLLLLEAVDKENVDIAKEVKIHDKVHSMTHGHGYSSYRTDGEILDQDHIEIPFFPILSSDDLANCQLPKFDVAFSFLQGMVCLIKGMQQESTVWITPGSSGGPLFNANSELVGIASATSSVGYSSWVLLTDIQKFLADK